MSSRSRRTCRLDVAYRGHRGRWRWSAPMTSMPNWTSPATSTRPGAVGTSSAVATSMRPWGGPGAELAALVLVGA